MHGPSDRMSSTPAPIALPGTEKFPKAIAAIARACGVERQLQELVATGRGEFYLSLRNKGWEPMYIEAVGRHPYGPQIAVAHWYMQNGDMMRDPEITFVATPERWTPVEVTQHPVGAYHSAFKGNDEIDVRMAKGFLSLANMWASNLIDQGWADPERVMVESASIRVGKCPPLSVEKGKRLTLSPQEAIAQGGVGLEDALAAHEGPIHQLLYLASKAGQVDSVRLLLSRGASPDWNNQAALRAAPPAVLEIFAAAAGEAEHAEPEHGAGRRA